jgi:DNA-directed RNA polymerase specialized sigma24 family protein
MTSADEARFIQLWQQGLTHEAMAQALGCPVGTVKSRLHTLLQQGKIQRRRERASPPATPPRSPWWRSRSCGKSSTVSMP